MDDLHLNCFLIDSAQEFIKLLINPLKSNTIKIDNGKLYNKWIHNFLDLYNDRTNFLLLANTKMNGSSSIDLKILQKNYKENYRDMKENFRKLSIENNILLKEYGIFRLILFIFQYLQVFDDKSLNINLWNYCLKSMTFSKKCFFVGLLTLICQYTWIAALSYNVIQDFHPNTDFLIILITIISTIISCLYSFETFMSFINSVPLYKFLIKLHSDYPQLELSRNEKNYFFYKIRNINIKKIHIIYNLFADFLSNCILPLMIPILNIFIILNSETVVDAILNCMAIFFVIQVDEELYRITDYAREQECIIFTRWIISTIYCNNFPNFQNIFRKECENWHNSMLELTKKYKRRVSNKINPIHDGEPEDISISLYN